MWFFLYFGIFLSHSQLDQVAFTAFTASCIYWCRGTPSTCRLIYPPSQRIAWSFSVYELKRLNALLSGLSNFDKHSLCNCIQISAIKLEHGVVIQARTRSAWNGRSSSFNKLIVVAVSAGRMEVTQAAKLMRERTSERASGTVSITSPSTKRRCQPPAAVPGSDRPSQNGTDAVGVRRLSGDCRPRVDACRAGSVAGRRRQFDAIGRPTRDQTTGDSSRRTRRRKRRSPFKLKQNITLRRRQCVTSHAEMWGLKGGWGRGWTALRTADSNCDCRRHAARLPLPLGRTPMLISWQRRSATERCQILDRIQMRFPQQLILHTQCVVVVWDAAGTCCVACSLKPWPMRSNCWVLSWRLRWVAPMSDYNLTVQELIFRGRPGDPPNWNRRIL